MSLEAIAQCETNREAAYLAAADASQAQRVVLLWQRPNIPDHDVPEAVGIPPTLWSVLKTEGDTPPLFTIGRRLFVKTDDLRAWLDLKAKDGMPGSKKLRKHAAEMQRTTAKAARPW
jgi:hypothetical protein